MYRCVCFVLALLLGGSGLVDAQGFPRDIPGITVTGRATVRAHADALYVFAHLVPVAGASDDIDGAAAAVVATLTGLRATNLAVAASVNGASVVGRAITSTIADPTIPVLIDLSKAIGGALKPYPGTVLESLRVAPGLAQCATVEARLHSLALADARSRAEHLADAAGVTLGTPQVITPGGLPDYAFPCRPSRSIERVDANVDSLPMDGNVEFGLFVNVTYAIAGNQHQR